MSTLYLLHKPYRMLSQFTDSQGRSTLADVLDAPGVYAAGRLDYDSEGLLLLSDDGNLIHRIAHPRHKQPKTYWVLARRSHYRRGHSRTRIRRHIERWAHFARQSSAYVAP